MHNDQKCIAYLSCNTSNVALDVKHLLDEAETNIQNYYAFVVNGGRRRRRSPPLPTKA